MKKTVKKKAAATIAASVDAYIQKFPAETQEALEQVRAAVKRAAPQAVEKISYAMPAFELHGILVYFAGYKSHIGFYATPSGHSEFDKALAKYKVGKGSVQFPLDEKMPVKLIEKMVKFRVKENLEKIKSKQKKKRGTK
jgi:uncharacterized protein YdhG (YjbR/CyaY superfamily)